MGRSKTETPKGRVLTPSELELAEQLREALVGKVTAEAMLTACRREISRLTGEINKLGLSRASLVWIEARETAGTARATKVSELVRG